MIRPVTFAGCFGWLHQASGIGTAERGVVICAPHGYEELCTHRALRDCASALAQAGFPTLRFDYRGTGDSLESDERGGRVGAWLDSVDAAVGLLRLITGVRSVALVGLRLGALLAADVAARRDDVEALVLMAPALSGRRYLREQHALSRLTGDPVADPGDGSLNVAGFTYTEETREALKQLDLLSLARLPAARVLLLAREDQADGDGTLRRRLEALGAEVSVVGFDGYQRLMQDARLAETPTTAFAALVQWLAGPPTPKPADDVAFETDDRHAATLVHPQFTERAVQMTGSCLSAVLCTPRQQDRKSMITVFLNTSANRRIGYGRVWVEMARELARHGFPSLRLDVGGIGDSEARAMPGRLVYADESTLDVCRTIDHLQNEGYEHAVLIGLCSGASMAYHAALVDSRVHTQILVNLQYFHWREGDLLDVPARRGRIKSTDSYLRMARRGETWARLFRGEVAVGSVVRGLVDRYGHRLRARVAALVQRSDGGRSRVSREMAQLARRGVRTFAVYGADDPGRDEFSQQFGRGGRRFLRLPGCVLHVLEHADHNLAGRPARRELTAWLIGTLQAHAATAPQPASTAMPRIGRAPAWSQNGTLDPRPMKRSTRNA